MNRYLAMLVTATALTSASLSGCSSEPELAAPACAPELDDGLRAWADAGFSGSIAMSTGGEFDCLAAYGLADEATSTPNTTDTVFSIGSVSKAFTAAAIFSLVDSGHVSLGDRAGDLVPGLAGPIAEATVHQLLLHTSGLIGSHGEDDQPLDRDAAINAISRLEQAFEPGTEFLYSNAGYTLLALIVEEVAGMSYRDYMSSRILTLPDGHVVGGFWDGEPAAPEPRSLGYRDGEPTGAIGYLPGPHWAVDGNGDLAMTTADLATWTHALFTGQLVSAESTSAIATAGFDRDDGTAVTPGWVAFDESLFGARFLGTAGGGGDVGHNAVVVWLPDSAQVIAIASNTDGVTGEDLLQAIGPALIAGRPLPDPETSAAEGGDVDPATLDAFVGEYELETAGSFAISVRDDQLVIAANGSDAIAALFPLPEDFSADEVASHERNVVALLAGESQEGDDERAALESDLGPIEGVQIVATIIDEGELHTYVVVSSAGETMMLWYALDEAGGIAAAEGPADPPTRLLIPTGDAEHLVFRVDDPTGAGPAVTVAFEGDTVLVTGPDGTTAAVRAAG